MAYRNWNTYGQQGFTPGSDGGGVSSWHSAPLINQRIHNGWMEFGRLWKSGDLMATDNCLRIQWGEFSADANKDQISTINELDSEIKKCKSKILKPSNSNDIHATKNLLSDLLIEKYLFMKIVEKMQGKGTSYRDETEDDID